MQPQLEAVIFMIKAMVKFTMMLIFFPFIILWRMIRGFLWFPLILLGLIIDDH